MSELEAVPTIISNKRKIAIVCGSPSSEYLAPFDTEWEIWVLGSRISNYKGKRVDRIFEIHEDVSHYPEEFSRWATELKIPLVVSTKWAHMQDHVEVFPFEKAEEMMGSTYLTSSTAYMMAYAIMEQPDEIAVYGVDMAVDDDEYFRQRPCVEAWMGLAKGKGIKITIPEVSPVMKATFIYGTGTGNRGGLDTGVFSYDEFTKLAKEHKTRMSEIEKEIHGLQMAMNAQAGAQQAYERMAQVARAITSGNDIKSLQHTAVIK